MFSFPVSPRNSQNMASSSSSTPIKYCFPPFSIMLCVFSLIFRASYGLGSFTFDIHHRYSDAVRGILPDDGLPERGSVDYYAAMVHRDHFIRARRLAATAEDPTPLTFASGNETYRIAPLGFLHYANVTVGTPPASYLVALDTGSDLFWLPCDCVNCSTGLRFSSGEVLDFSIYSLNRSSTGKEVLCSSSLCEYQNQCFSPSDRCPYKVSYLSSNTSSAGYLVEDVLHLITNDDQSRAVDAKITLGCGKDQSGAFLASAAPNGLFGLGIENISVPSILANGGLTSNSFSLCFGPRGFGRIEFGDKGSTSQSETPFNLGRKHPSYDISITQISVGGNVSNLNFSAIFDSGTSFTYLNDPAYSLISEKFDSIAEEKRYTLNSDIPFEYCYELRPNQTSFKYAVMNLTMKGGEPFFVNNPLILFASEVTQIYCLAIARSRDINIIGQNFMSGYRIVFDREKMVLGWKKSNCSGYDVKDEADSSLLISPSPTPITPHPTGSPQANNDGSSSSPQTKDSPGPSQKSSSSLQNSIIVSLSLILLQILFSISSLY